MQRENDLAVDTVRTDRIQMEYCRFGRGKEILVILPGLSVQSVIRSAQAVARAYQEMTEAFTVYLFDRRKNLPPVYPIGEMAEDTAEAMRALGIGKANIFGSSQGGLIALEIAVRHPDLAQKLIVGSIGPCPTEAGRRVIETWIRLAREGDADALYREFGRAVYPERMRAQVSGLFAVMAKDVTREELDRFAIIAEGTRDYDASDRLDRIQCPVLMIGSRDDGVMGPEYAGQLERLESRPGFQTFLYENYGHAAYDLAPDYRARMTAFLSAPGKARV